MRNISVKYLNKYIIPSEHITLSYFNDDKRIPVGIIKWSINFQEEIDTLKIIETDFFYFDKKTKREIFRYCKLFTDYIVNIKSNNGIIPLQEQINYVFKWNEIFGITIEPSQIEEINKYIKSFINRKIEILSIYKKNVFLSFTLKDIVPPQWEINKIGDMPKYYFPQGKYLTIRSFNLIAKE